MAENWKDKKNDREIKARGGEKEKETNVQRKEN